MCLKLILLAISIIVIVLIITDESGRIRSFQTPEQYYQRRYQQRYQQELNKRLMKKQAKKKQRDLKFNKTFQKFIKSNRYKKDTYLYKGKIFKGQVYHQLKQITENIYKEIWFVSGREGIGKTTSILAILNQKRRSRYKSKHKHKQKVDMTLYFSLEEIDSLQQLKKNVIYSNIWKMVKNWRSLQDKHKKLNLLINKTFSKQRLLVVIDQAERINQYCKQSCPQQVRVFLRDLKKLAKNGASIMLISSDPDFDYLWGISGFRYDYFQRFQIFSQNSKDFDQMFTYYQINERTQELLLKNFNQRENIISYISLVQDNTKLKSQQNKYNAYMELINNQLQFVNQRQEEPLTMVLRDGNKEKIFYQKFAAKKNQNKSLQTRIQIKSENLKERIFYIRQILNKDFIQELLKTITKRRILNYINRISQNVYKGLTNKIFIYEVMSSNYKNSQYQKEKEIEIEMMCIQIYSFYFQLNSQLEYKQNEISIICHRELSLQSICLIADIIELVFAMLIIRSIYYVHYHD